MSPLLLPYSDYCRLVFVDGVLSGLLSNIPDGHQKECLESLKKIIEEINLDLLNEIERNEMDERMRASRVKCEGTI